MLLTLAILPYDICHATTLLRFSLAGRRLRQPASAYYFATPATLHGHVYATSDSRYTPHTHGRHGWPIRIGTYTQPLSRSAATTPSSLYATATSINNITPHITTPMPFNAVTLYQHTAAYRYATLFFTYAAGLLEYRS